MKNKSPLLSCTLAALALFAAPLRPALAQEPVAPEGERLVDELRDGFYSRVNILAFLVAQDPRSSPVNPNNVLEIPSYQAVLNPRVDLELGFRNWEFGLKPRAELVYERWEEGIRDGDDETDAEAYINEGWVRYRPFDELVLSVGRENLQWGPSIIVSSSNPFNRDNGRNNPRLELPGLDFARAVWVPSPEWALSAIANFGEGRLDDGASLTTSRPLVPGTAVDDDDFEEIYAFKLDYTGFDTYASLIPSYRDGDQYRLGFFAGWNASEALLLYTEGSLAEEDGAKVQVGGAYTLEAGPTITAEYYRNDDGCVGRSVAACFLAGKIDPREVLIRRNYLMLQLSDTTLVRDLDFSLRFIRNLDDGSNRLIGIFEHEVGDHVQLYLIANGFTGSTRTEFGSLLRYSLFAGIGYTF